MATVIVVAVFIAGHLPFTGAPYTNIECWTGEAARLAGEGKVLEAVQTYQGAVSIPRFAFFSIIPFYRALGVSEFTTRMPTLVAGTATILIVFLAASRWYTPALGALGAAATPPMRVAPTRAARTGRSIRKGKERPAISAR